MMRKKLIAVLIFAWLMTILTINSACQKNGKAGSEDGSSKKDGKETHRQIASSVLKNLRIVKKPLENVDLDIPHVYSPGISYLATLAATVEAYDPDLTVAKVMFYSGPIYEKWQERRNGKNTTMTAPMRPPTALLSTIKNLGYQAYIGYNTKGFNEFKKTYLQEEEGQIYQEFRNEGEALDFMKRILSSKIPVVVNVDEEFFGGKSSSDFVVVTGYDKENIYFNDPGMKPEQGGKSGGVKIADFMKAWSSGKVEKNPNIMLFLKRISIARPDVEILTQIKKEALVISSYLNKDADRLEKGDPAAKEELQYFGIVSSAKRTALVIVLKEKNFNDIAEKYNQIAKLYAEIGPNTDPKEAAQKFREIAKKEKEASLIWK